MTDRMADETDEYWKKVESNVGQRVADVVLERFNKVSVKSGKPTIRSNGVKEWTVLSGLVALIPSQQNEIPSIDPLVVATGAKVLPERVRSYSRGFVVHDQHAEILALRLFNWYLVEECRRVHLEGKESKLVEKIEGTNKFKMRDVKLALYVSEPPCGDASATYLEESIGQSENWDFESKGDGVDSSILRGRSYFGKRGQVRTKPGRGDSLLSLSKSCSDKLCLRQYLGITNAINSHLFPQGVYLDYLILPREKYKNIDLERCFRTRFELEEAEVHYLKALVYDKDDFQYRRPGAEELSEPSHLSLLYVVPTNSIQVLNRGVRNGCFVKNKRPRPGGECFICNQMLYRRAQPLLHHNSSTYIQFKHSNFTRQMRKIKAKHALHDGLQTTRDDFDL